MASLDSQLLLSPRGCLPGSQNRGIARSTYEARTKHVRSTYRARTEHVGKNHENHDYRCKKNIPYVFYLLSKEDLQIPWVFPTCSVRALYVLCTCFVRASYVLGAIARLPQQASLHTPCSWYWTPNCPAVSKSTAAIRAFVELNCTFRTWAWRFQGQRSYACPRGGGAPNCAADSEWVIQGQKFHTHSQNFLGICKLLPRGWFMSEDFQEVLKTPDMHTTTFFWTKHFIFLNKTTWTTHDVNSFQKELWTALQTSPERIVQKNAFVPETWNVFPANMKNCARKNETFFPENWTRFSEKMKTF